MRGPLRLFLALLVLAAAPPVSPAGPASREEFFIVSSLDPARGRVVLKRPTEVTLVMHVDGQTAYRDERGAPLSLKELRSGDTVYITFRQDPGAEPTALRVRRGAMTIEELERRYLHRTGPAAPL